MDDPGKKKPESREMERAETLSLSDQINKSLPTHNTSIQDSSSPNIDQVSGSKKSFSPSSSSHGSLMWRKKYERNWLGTCLSLLCFILPTSIALTMQVYQMYSIIQDGSSTSQTSSPTQSYKWTSSLCFALCKLVILMLVMLTAMQAFVNPLFLYGRGKQVRINLTPLIVMIVMDITLVSVGYFHQIFRDKQFFNCPKETKWICIVKTGIAIIFDYGTAWINLIILWAWSGGLKNARQRVLSHLFMPFLPVKEYENSKQPASVSESETSLGA